MQLTLGYKCDGERPHCARCLRGGHRCDGYDRSRKFVHTFAEPVVSKTGEKDLAAQRRSSEDAAAFVTINVNAQIRSQLFSLFIDSYIPSSPVGKVNFRCAQTSNLIEVFPRVMNGRNSQLLDRAISALATVFVGKTVGDDRLIRHGIMLYNNAIQVFARLIPRAGLPVQEVLCANVVFQLYEVRYARTDSTAPADHISSSIAPPVSLAGWHTWKVPMPYWPDMKSPWRGTSSLPCYFATSNCQMYVGFHL